MPIRLKPSQLPAAMRDKLKPKRQKRAKASPASFIAACRGCGLPIPEPEFPFAPPRKWRFDWYWPIAKVALEIQGGLFIQGRHARGAALLNEHEKLNTAACMGIVVLYCTPKQFASGEIMYLLQRALVKS